MTDVLSRLLQDVLGGAQPPAAEAGRLGGMPGGAAPMQEQGGLGALLGGLLGGAQGRPDGAPGPTIAGVREMAVMALLAWLMQGRGGVQGLSALTGQLRSAGLGPQVDSWISQGPNEPMRPEELARAIPPGALDTVTTRTGIARDEVLAELSRGLPGMVDRLTPAGRLPERDAELEGYAEQDVLGAFGIGRRV